MILELITVAGLASLAYKFRSKLFGAAKAEATVLAGKGSAFARVAEQEGKLIALNAVVSVKKEAALAVHKSLDAIDSILG